MTSKFAYRLKISTNHKRAFIKHAMRNSSVIERSIATTRKAESLRSGLNSPKNKSVNLKLELDLTNLSDDS
jgi:hypothetical protein